MAVGATVRIFSDKKGVLSLSMAEAIPERNRIACFSYKRGRRGMALTAEEQDRVRSKMEQLQRQKTMQQVIDEMSKLQEYVDKNGWDAFLGCIYIHGGGFFYIGEYFIGVLTCIGGYAMTLYGVWLLISSALSYIWHFERSWDAAFMWIIGSCLYDVVLGICAGIMARRVRERSRFALDILHERCSECCDKK